MYLKRTHYLDKLIGLIKTPLIVVLVWVRRVWKSVILKQFVDMIGKEKCLLIDKEDSEYSHIRNAEDLEMYIRKHISWKKHLLIDEIQYVENREKAILSIYTRYKDQINIIITGSNSSLLSGEIGTKLRGRTIDIMVYPFTFWEYMAYFSIEDKSKSDQFLSYLQQWGLPSTFALPTEMSREWINNLINTVFLQDIVERRWIKDVWLLRSLYDYLVDNVGNVLSISSLISAMKQRNIDTNYNTLSSYIDYMSQALLIYSVPFYDIKGKTIFEKRSKVYSFDHNTKLMRHSGYDIGYGKYLENYIYLSLLISGWSVYIGKLGEKEIDFIAEKDGEKIYIQVAYLLSSDQIVQREFGNFQDISDNWKKYVVSMDPVLHSNIEWIQHVQAWNRESIIHRKK